MTQINHIELDLEINVLGVYLAPDGNNNDQMAALRAKAEKWANNIQSLRANSEEVLTALYRTIPFSLCYSLPAITLTKDECQYMMAPITNYGLPLVGIASTTPHVMKLGPVSMGRMGNFGSLHPYGSESDIVLNFKYLAENTNRDTTGGCNR